MPAIVVNRNFVSDGKFGIIRSALKMLNNNKEVRHLIKTEYGKIYGNCSFLLIKIEGHALQRTSLDVVGQYEESAETDI